MQKKFFACSRRDLEEEEILVRCHVQALSLLRKGKWKICEGTSARGTANCSDLLRCLAVADGSDGHSKDFMVESHRDAEPEHRYHEWGASINGHTKQQQHPVRSLLSCC